MWFNLCRSVPLNPNQPNCSLCQPPCTNFSTVCVDGRWCVLLGSSGTAKHKHFVRIWSAVHDMYYRCRPRTATVGDQDSKQFLFCRAVLVTLYRLCF